MIAEIVCLNIYVKRVDTLVLMLKKFRSFGIYKVCQKLYFNPLTMENMVKYSGKLYLASVRSYSQLKGLFFGNMLKVLNY